MLGGGEKEERMYQVGRKQVRRLLLILNVLWELEPQKLGKGISDPEDTVNKGGEVEKLV